MAIMDLTHPNTIQALANTVTMYKLLGLPSPDSITPGQILRICRALKGWNMNELAEMSGVDRVTIKSLEADLRQPQTETIRKLSLVFGQDFIQALKFVSAVSKD